MGDIPEPEAAMAIHQEPSSCLTLRVFYLRLTRCVVDESMLDALTVTLIPLTPDTVLEASGGGGGDKQQQKPTSISIEKRGVSCPLRVDRADAKAEEATFVSTATVRVAGSVRFEVRNGDDERLLVGILETCDVESLLLGGDVTEKSGTRGRRRRSWVMKCQAATQGGSGFLRCGCRAAKQPPTVEVFVAGVFRGTPIVFTKAMHLRFRRRRRRVRAVMDPIPECDDERAEDAEETAAQDEHGAAEEPEHGCYKPDPEADDDGFYTGERDDGELSWFTAGVRVGVGISLGICCIGAGLLVRSYQSTSRTLTRRLISKLL